MWDEEPDIFEALEEHSFEYESSDDFSDLELNSDIAEEFEEEDALDKDGKYADYEG